MLAVLKLYYTFNVISSFITLNFQCLLLFNHISNGVFSNVIFAAGVVLSPVGPLHISTKAHLDSFVSWQSPSVFCFVVLFSSKFTKTLFICFSELWFTKAALHIILTQCRYWEKW